MKTINWWRRFMAWLKGAPTPRRLEEADDMLRTQILDMRRFNK
jgi:hypothetical protein